jgi:hypothetical protein
MVFVLSMTWKTFPRARVLITLRADDHPVRVDSTGEFENFSEIPDVSFIQLVFLLLYNEYFIFPVDAIKDF